MKAAILVDQKKITRETPIAPLAFAVERDQVPSMIFQKGLDGTEAVRLQILASGKNRDDKDLSTHDWIDLLEDGTPTDFNATKNYVVIDAPGNYRIILPFKTRNAITVGRY